MAVPSYTTDLSDVNLAETTTGWSAYGGGSSGLDQNADIAMQGSFCVGKQISAADKGQYYTSTAITLGTGDHVWIWHFCGTPGLTDTIQNKGASVRIGTGTAALCEYHIAGNDTYGAAGRVAKCYPINYSTRNTSATYPYRTATGSPGASPTIFGGGLVTTATVKGFNVGIDAIRYGLGGFLTAGELISAGDGSTNPCTFTGYQTTNDTLSNRWGILTFVAGSYELQGTFAIGQNNAGTATLYRFEDTNKNITIADTFHSASDFTKFIIDHASTVCNWNNINITALGTINPGQIVVTANNPTFNITGGTFTGIGTSVFRSNTTINGTTFRSTGQITQNSSTITNAFIINSAATSAILSDAPGSITDTSFTSAGTGHAIEVTSTGTYSFTGLTFEGYATTNGTTGNEVFYNNSGGAITINASGVTGTISVRNSAGSSTTVNNTVSITISGLKDNTEVRVYDAVDLTPPYSTPVELAGTENATTGTTDNRSFSFSATPSSTVYIRVFNTGWIADDTTYNVPGTNATIQIPQRRDRVYSNP